MAQDLRGDPEREIGDHPKRLFRQWCLQHVALDHGDRGPGGELGAQPLGQRRVPLDREHLSSPAHQSRADQAISRTDVDHQVPVAHPGTVHEGVDRAAVDEEILAKSPAPDGSVRHSPEPSPHSAPVSVQQRTR